MCVSPRPEVTTVLSQSTGRGNDCSYAFCTKVVDDVSLLFILNNISSKRAATIPTTSPLPRTSTSISSSDDNCSVRKSKMAEDSPAAAEEIAALTCNETEALLQVKYNITEDEWDNSRPQFPSFNQRAFLRIRGNEVVEYENFADVKNYEVCLPRDECSEIVVAGLPTDAYELSFDGKAVEIGHEFFFDGTNPVTSTEVGTDCPFTKPPICKDTEALLEIQYWGGSFDYNFYHFRVEDKDGGTILSGEPVGLYSLKNSYACLPKDDACYTFLIGGEYQMPAYIHPLPSYSLIFDGVSVFILAIQSLYYTNIFAHHQIRFPLGACSQ